MNQIEITNKDKTRLTRKQKNLVVKIVKNHIEDQNYTFSWTQMYICRYFVTISLYFYPKGHENNPYLSMMKTFQIGTKGAMQKATYMHGISKVMNITKVAHYYFNPED